MFTSLNVVRMALFCWEPADAQQFADVSATSAHDVPTSTRCQGFSWRDLRHPFRLKAGAGVTRCTSSFRIRPFLPPPQRQQVRHHYAVPPAVRKARQGFGDWCDGFFYDSLRLKIANSCADVTVLPSLTIILLNSHRAGPVFPE